MTPDSSVSGIQSLKAALRLILGGYIFLGTYSANASDALFTKPLDQYKSYSERPLFAPTRRAQPVETAPIDHEEPASVQPLSAALLGVISTNDGSAIAMVRLDGQNEIQRIHLGESIEGWTFGRLDGHDVVFLNGDQETILTFPTKSNDESASDDANSQVEQPAPPIMPTISP